MMRLKGDLVTLFEYAVDGKLNEIEAEWDRRTALGVVQAAANYPDTPRTGDVIHGLPTGLPAAMEDVQVFHAATAQQGKDVVTSGGRVLCVTALGDTVKQAQQRAYEVAEDIRFNGRQMRLDHWASGDQTLNYRALGQHLRAGGLIAYPTESCYGLGCDPRNREAVKNILRLKKRPQAKGMILIAADFKQLRSYVKPLTAAQLQKAQSTWPGPHTWLMPKSVDCPVWLTGKHEKVAVRVTAHKPAASLCRGLGMALVSTSANISGGKAIRSARECQRQFGSQPSWSPA